MTSISPVWFCILVGVEYLVFRKERINGRGKQRSAAFQCAVLGALVKMVALIVAAFFFQGFAKSPYDHSLAGMVKNGVHVFPWLWCRECYRSRIVNSGNKKYALIKVVVISVIFFLCEINYMQLGSIQEKKELFIYVMQVLLPAFTEQILLGIFVYYGGRKAAFFYAAQLAAFEWYFPVAVSLNWLVSMFLGMGIPVFLGMLLSEKMQEKKHLKKKENVYIDSAVVVGCIAILWFFAGVFPVYPSVVLTGSMQPYVFAGDMILVKKIHTPEEVEALKEGEILFFTQGNVKVSHRIIHIDKEKLTFQTKGDNNSEADRKAVKAEEIKGKVIGKVRKVGLLVVWIKGADTSVKEKVEF